MCGIVGVFAFKNENVDKKQVKKREAMTYLFTELLQATQIRGKDATGVTALFDDGNFFIQKGGVPAEEFIGNYGEEKSNYNTFISSCKEYKEPLKLLVGHCRKSSVGNSVDNVNNHPIRAGEIVGVHNGTLSNHEIIFKKLDCERDGKVDSEAIMRLLQFYTKDCEEPFTLDMLTEVACRLDGAFSVIAYNANNPYQVALMRKARPMEITLIRSLQIMLVASEKIFVDHAIFEFNKFARVYKSGFQTIEQKDVNHVVLPADNVAIVDLTKNIGQDSLVNDVVEKFDTFKCKKYWQSSYTTPATYGNYNNRTTPYNNFTRTDTGKKNDTINAEKSVGNTTTLPPTTKQKSNTPFVGKVYCKDLGRYVDVKKADDLSNTPAVIFTNNSSNLKLLGNVTTTNPATTKELTETKDLDIVNIGNKPATIEVITPKVVAEAISLAANTPKIIVSTEEQEDTEMSKLAQLAALGVSKFNTEDELVTFLQANSLLSVKSLPLHALANRIINVVYEKAFYEGLMCNPKTQKETDVSKVVRISKHIVRLFGKVLGIVCPDKQNMAKAMMSVIEDSKLSELTRENMLYTFSKGDLVANIGLIELVKIINAKNNGKENSTTSV